jgi:hypothetical protein
MCLLTSETNFDCNEIKRVRHYPHYSKRNGSVFLGLQPNNLKVEKSYTQNSYN